MSAISREIQRSLRRQVIEATEEAAKREGVAVDADALAVLSQPELLFVVAPIADVAKLDFRALLEGESGSGALDDRPVMYWHLSGDALGDDGGGGSGRNAKEKRRLIPAGFYTVVADQGQGEVRLVDASGATAARGDLTVIVDPPPAGTPTTMAKVKVSGKITSTDVSLFPPHVKVCGTVTVKEGNKSITISGCVEAGF
jgi:hypothetical protein